MIKILVVGALLAISSTAFARGGGGHSSGPHYGGGSHTASHGGTYRGGSGGSSHRGGHYVNPTTGNQYGKHK